MKNEKTTKVDLGLITRGTKIVDEKVADDLEVTDPDSATGKRMVDAIFNPKENNEERTEPGITG